MPAGAPQPPTLLPRGPNKLVRGVSKSGEHLSPRPAWGGGQCSWSANQVTNLRYDPKPPGEAAGP